VSSVFVRFWQDRDLSGPNPQIVRRVGSDGNGLGQALGLGFEPDTANGQDHAVA